MNEELKRKNVNMPPAECGQMSQDLRTGIDDRVAASASPFTFISENRAFASVLPFDFRHSVTTQPSRSLMIRSL